MDGIYSDLLVHDLGPDLGDTGQYGVFTPGSSDPEFEDDPTPAGPAQPGAITDEALTQVQFAEPMPPPGGFGILARMFVRGMEGRVFPQIRETRENS